MDIENNFKYHSPTESQKKAYVEIRSKAKELAELVKELVPECREQSLTFTKIEESVFWANAGIARNG